MFVWKSDAASNRSAPKYSRSEQLRRVAWAVGHWLLRLSPRPFFAWRQMVLRVFGARVGKHVHVYPSTRILMPWNVELNDWCALGEDVYIYSLGCVGAAPRCPIARIYALERMISTIRRCPAETTRGYQR
jgi:putative colanic acid biosynthesis acetyltransferase WcaF